jgi:hypothetical protein
LDWLSGLWTTLARRRVDGYVLSMSVTHRVRLNCLLACAASLTMTLAACGGSSSAPKSLPTLPSATDPAPTSASPTPTATSKKAELAAAKAVVVRYFSVVNAMHIHMDAQALDALFTKDCTCQAQVRAVRRAAKRGEHYTDHASINAIRPNIDGQDLADVLVDYDTRRGGLVDSTGHRVTSTTPKKHVRWVFRLQRLAGDWRITRIEIVR